MTTGRLPAEMAIGEVKLKVGDLKRAVTFYREVLGFQVLREEGRTAELTVDGKKALVVLEEVADPVIVRPRTVTGLYHYAILVPSRKDLGLVLANLTKWGIPIGQADHNVSEAIYISDPDHNGIEIYRDRPRSEWTYDRNNQIVMASDPLDIDGILREAAGHEWEGLPAATTIGHVHLHVNSLEKARWFYCDVLGFDMMMDVPGFRALFVSAGGYHHHLGLNVWAGIGAPAPPDNGTGLVYYTLTFPEREQVDAVVARLTEHGIHMDASGYHIEAKDPSSGVTIRLTWGTNN